MPIESLTFWGAELNLCPQFLCIYKMEITFRVTEMPPRLLYHTFPGRLRIVIRKLIRLSDVVIINEHLRERSGDLLILTFEDAHHLQNLCVVGGGVWWFATQV